MSDFNLQNSYLFGCVELVTVKRRYGNDPNASRRKHTFMFKIKLDGQSLRLCKKSFLSIHGLQKSRGRMAYVIKSLVNKAVTPPKDQRGTHQNRPNRIQQDSLQSVHDHIESIPKYQSHYSRFSNPNKVYLGLI